MHKEFVPAGQTVYSCTPIIVDSVWCNCFGTSTMFLYLLSRLKATLEWNRLGDDKEVQECVTAILNVVPKMDFSDSFRKIYESCQKCLVWTTLKVNIGTYKMCFFIFINPFTELLRHVLYTVFYCNTLMRTFNLCTIKKHIYHNLLFTETAPSESEHAVSSNPILPVLAFLQALTSSCADGRIVCSRQPTIGKGSLKYLLLNPAAHFSDVVQQARSVSTRYRWNPVCI